MSGTSLKLKGNDVLLLDDPGTGWIVEHGELALFGTTLTGDRPSGSRRFFHSIGPDQGLFGFESRDGGRRPVIIAVALEETTLRRLSTDTASWAGADGVEPLARRWQEGWERCLAEPPEPAELDSAAAFRNWQATLLDRVLDVIAREDETERSRFEARVRQSDEATHQAVSELTSVLRLDSQQLPQGSAMFVSASAVGEALGLQLRPPAEWEGDSADPVDMIARASHLRVRRVVLHEGWWCQDCGPLLVFSGRERSPMAALPRGPRRYELLDPESRECHPIDADVASRIDPSAVTFYRPLPERATRGTELIRFAMRGRGRDLAMILATAVAATMLGMFTPQATALLVDAAIPDANTSLLWQIGLGLLAASLGAAMFRLAQGIAMMRVETAADVTTQSAVWDRLLNLQLSFFRRFSTGDLQSRVTAISQIRAYLSGTTLRTLFSSVVALLNLFLLLYYSRSLTIVAIAAAALSIAVTVISGMRILHWTREIWERKGKFFGLMVQLVNGVAKLRVAAAEQRALSRWSRDYAELLRLELRERRLRDTVQAINIALSTASTIALFGIAASLTSQFGGQLTTGVFLAFYAAYGTFIGAVTSLSNTVTDVMAIAILRERARPILEALPEVNERKADPGRLQGRLDVDHVAFQYQAEGPVILNGLTMHVGPGQFVALVGPSGCGKSTLFRLLLGFETPDSGSVYYDGQELSGLDVFAVRRQMGVVLQAGRINAGSIFDNIVSGANLTLNDTWEAARATGFADEVKAMPMGMHTIVSEGGTNLSGGQRQRLLIARALVHRPSVLLLDEATSALDNTTQAIVSESLRNLEVTRMVIAHRLSTIRDADQIYVIDGGRIVQQGVFNELAGETGLFARLMARQMA